MQITDENINDTFQIFRFGQKQYIEQFADGYFSFSCPGAYINQAINSGNNEQGDKYEAIFARLKKSDHRIETMKVKLQDDLEIIEDGEYVLLRRYSARLVPVFCFFNYKIADLREGELGEYKNGIVPIKMEFNEKMYSGFKDKVSSDKENLVLVHVDTIAFINKVKSFLNSPLGNAVNARMRDIDYDRRSDDTFFIEPTDDYDELKYKRPRYRYQHEGRIYFPQYQFFSEKDRYTLFAGAFDEEQLHIVEDLPMTITYYCSARKIDDR